MILKEKIKRGQNALFLFLVFVIRLGLEPKTPALTLQLSLLHEPPSTLLGQVLLSGLFLYHINYVNLGTYRIPQKLCGLLN